MSISYSLYLNTQADSRHTLASLFNLDNVAPIEGTDIFYARGSVFLAHGRDCRSDDPANQKIAESFGLLPTVSVAFFPDGVSNFQTALNLLLDAILAQIETSTDALLLLANKKELVLQRDATTMRVAEQHSFWSSGRLSRLTLPYEAV